MSKDVTKPKNAQRDYRNEVRGYYVVNRETDLAVAGPYERRGDALEQADLINSIPGRETPGLLTVRYRLSGPIKVPTRPAVPDNGGSRSQQSQSQKEPREEFLTVLHFDPMHRVEVEGCTVRFADGIVTLQLEDGERLAFDEVELRAIVEAP